MKKIIVSAIAVMLLFLSACGSPKFGGDKPNSKYGGYYAPGQTMFYGEQTEDIYINDIQALMKSKTETQVTIKLGLDSDGQKKLSKTPYFEMDNLSSPSRIIVWIENVVEMVSPQFDDDSLVEKISSLSSQNQRVGILLQLKEEAAAKVEVSNDQITIHLKSLQMKPISGWYVTWYAMTEYNNNQLTDASKIGMAPTICQGGDNKVLISKRFNTPDEAKKQKQIVDKAGEKQAPGRMVEVVYLETKKLPKYNASGDMKSIETALVARINQKPSSLPLQWTWARMMAISRDGVTRAYSVQSQDGESEELWIEKNSNRSKLSNEIFTWIDSAIFSPDGKYIAFVDVLSDDARVLYIINLTTKELFNASDDGLGSVGLGDVAWSLDSSRVYSIASSGYDNYQLRSYNVTVKNKQGRIAPLLEQSCDMAGSVMQGIDGVYFTQEGENNLLYRVKGQSTVKAQETSMVTISPNGQYMAFVEYTADDNNPDQRPNVLKVKNLKTNETKTILNTSQQVLQIVYSTSGEKLYYCLDSQSQDDNEPYPNLIYVYSIVDGTSKYLLDLAGNAMRDPLLADGQGHVFAQFFFDQSAERRYVTYRLP